LKLPILKFFFSFLFSVVEETVESASFLGKLNSGTVLNGSPNPVSLRVAVFGLNNYKNIVNILFKQKKIR
jgi:hypothetical protein